MKISTSFNLAFQNIFLSTIIIGALLLSTSLSAQESETEDVTLSPYFFVMSEDTTLDQMPLKSTSADVMISGVISDVTVKQTYCNEGEKTLEAIYVFPASTKAAVYYMQMEVGNRLLIARIAEKEKAREEYEEAREEGRTATLLEQERPNVFQMNVANILPGDTIVVEMRYTELLVPTEGIYEFMYPTVVGPRYATPSAEGEEWVASPYQRAGEEPLYDFSINVTVNAGMKIKEVYSTSHPFVEFRYKTENTAYCSESFAGNKDFVMQYRLSGAQIESGLLLYEGEEEKFFLAMIQPPKNPQDYQIPPREYVFIMDVSGSMRGFPIEVSKTLLIDLVGNLRSQDRFNMLFFAGSNYVLSDVSLPATEENINLALDAISNQLGGGGTEILPALQRALSLPGTEDFARTFVIATDGYVHVEKQSFDLIRNNLNEASFFAFGIGSSVNRYIIEGMARVGMGEPFIVLNQDEAPEKAEKFREYVQYPVLTNIKVNYNDFDVFDVEPVTVPDVIAERPVTLFGKWRSSNTGTIVLEGLSGSQTYNEILDVSKFTPEESNSALKYLWARFKIQLLDDYSEISYYEQDSIKAEVTELGLKYNLLTQYTSFIAVDSLIRADTSEITTVKQPLPMPEGVPNEAIGEDMRSTSEASFGYYSGKSLAVNSIEAESPDKSLLQKNYPNPFGNSTMIRFFISLEDANQLKQLEIYNYLGQLVYQVDLSEYKEGWHDIFIILQKNNTTLPSGFYYAKLRIADKQVSSLRLSYVKN